MSPKIFHFFFLNEHQFPIDNLAIISKSSRIRTNYLLSQQNCFPYTYFLNRELKLVVIGTLNLKKRLGRKLDEKFKLFFLHSFWICVVYVVKVSIVIEILGWGFTKLLTQIRNIFLNFKVLLCSSYS